MSQLGKVEGNCKMQVLKWRSISQADVKAVTDNVERVERYVSGSLIRGCDVAFGRAA